MTKVIYCGPRGLWRIKNTNTYLTQIVKWEETDGVPQRFVLTDQGEWRAYNKDKVWEKDENFTIDLAYEIDA